MIEIGSRWMSTGSFKSLYTVEETLEVETTEGPLTVYRFDKHGVFQTEEEIRAEYWPVLETDE